MSQAYSTKSTKKNSRRWRPVIFAAVGLLLISFVFAGYKLMTRGSIQPTPQKETIFYEPATDDEKAESESKKDDIVNEQKDINSTDGPSTMSGSTIIKPIVSSADGSRATAYIQGIIEDGGTCTYTFAPEVGASKVLTATGLSNASNTSCPSVKPNLANGKWKLIVTYNSSKVSGASSTAYTFEVGNE